MDDHGLRESQRQRTDNCKVGHPMCNAIPHDHIKEQNAFFMNTKISSLLAERNAALEQRDRALLEKKAAVDERDAAIQQRDVAVAERDSALRERDNAIASLQFHKSTIHGALGCSSTKRGVKRLNHHRNPHANHSQSLSKSDEARVTQVISLAVIPSEALKSQCDRERMGDNSISASTTQLSKRSTKPKKIGEDLNRHITTDGSKAEWDALDLSSIQLINFDGSRMPIPVCTCTGVARQCYKWGSGGWQSSCCTTSLSVYPLPQMPNKRHGRMGGRKMSGSVFGRLLTRMAAAGHDLSIPVDLKNYWAKHGTNRYITIK
ncbi:OLC1v1003372C1 [Oldenlandia corymbosa var. corymbosa]|uniref:GAGA-binding transcriptional activator n=1 Tax=Oldenlandia corymbosa var. corymbosa TaxID=529605 RepID=A0AAV1DD97_OLDCO|nr:OLC1v1003372C1 [Oldenlandia corymbosa var. corymbosa]